MPRAKEANKPGHVTAGNVLEDLGFSAEEIREMEIQHDLWVPIRAEIDARKLTQAQIAKVLRIHQPDASLLLRGQLARFSITRLMQFADRLGLAVTLAVGPKIETQRAKGVPRNTSRKNLARRGSTERAAVPHARRSRAEV
jgi:predicted XRE-type DNA-binding protein